MEKDTAPNLGGMCVYVQVCALRLTKLLVRWCLGGDFKEKGMDKAVKIDDREDIRNKGHSRPP
jgi:hypothetical protein